VTGAILISKSLTNLFLESTNTDNNVYCSLNILLTLDNMPVYDYSLCIVVQCLGADVVFDQLGLDVETEATYNHLGSIASLVFLRILEGTILKITL